ncbi:MAG TPA: VOC family protein [Ignavibacteria bacterium]|nr:VOC family protein [Ignavibacteria bacterium]
MKAQFILYVKDQTRSKNFYQRLLNIKPSLDVPGMTEFELSEECKIGLMPEDGIAKILSGQVPHPSEGNGIPRCELYLYVQDIQQYFDRAIKSSAKLISDIQNRDWGDKACYFADPDGHIIAFAERISE